MTRKELKSGMLLLAIILLGAGCKKETVKLYTEEATQITNNSAIVSGQVNSSVRLDELGVCYGTSANPTTNDKIKTADSDLTNFSCKLTNLQEGIVYYARTYAVTKNGNTYYGDVVSFETISFAGLPTISLQADKMTAESGETVTFTIRANSNTDTNKDLKLVKFDVIINDEIAYSNTDEVTTIAYEREYQLQFTGNAGETFKVIATVTDVAGKANTASVTIKIADHPLYETSFLWMRTGGGTVTGVYQFGLEWYGNYSKAVYATITPASGVKMYGFPSGVYANVTTESEKNAAFESATEITQWKEFNVDGAPTQTFNTVIGTKTTDGKYHLIHITNGSYYSDYYYGTTAEVTGMAK